MYYNTSTGGEQKQVKLSVVKKPQLVLNLAPSSTGQPNIQKPQLVLNVGSSTIQPVTQPTSQPITQSVNLTSGYAAADYKKYDQRTHVYMVPGMYGCSPDRFPRDEWLYDFQ